MAANRRTCPNCKEVIMKKNSIEVTVTKYSINEYGYPYITQEQLAKVNFCHKCGYDFLDFLHNWEE